MFTTRNTIELIVIAATLLLAYAAWGVEVSYRNAGGVVLSATPTPIGINSGRQDLSVHNDADSIDDIFCGYNLATLSATPGPNSGDKFNPGEGNHICQFPDHVFYCMTLGSATAYWDESRMVTPTATPP